MNKTESLYIPNHTHSIRVEDKRRGHDTEVFVDSPEAAVAKLDKLHQWARDNGYSPAEYTLTLNTI